MDSVSPCKVRWLLHSKYYILTCQLGRKKIRTIFFSSLRSVFSSGRKIFPSGPQQIFIYISLVTSGVCQNSQTCQSFPPWLVVSRHITKGSAHPTDSFKMCSSIIFLNFQGFCLFNFLNIHIFKLSGVYFGVWFDITFLFSPKDIQWYQ